MIAWILAVAMGVMVVALLVSEHQGWTIGSWLSKPAASILFIAVAVVQGALDHPIGVAILVGLVLSLMGDVALLMRGNQTAFLGGLGTFVLAHVAYAWAFIMMGGGWLIGLVLFMALGLVSIPVHRWLRPHLSHGMRVPVILYAVVISGMLAAAISSGIAGVVWLVPVGAFLFYLSDLFVARQRFVKEEFRNRAVGLPLYYAGQTMIAWSVASIPPAI